MGKLYLFLLFKPVDDVKMHVKVTYILLLCLCERWQGREYCGNGINTHSLSLHILKTLLPVAVVSIQEIFLGNLKLKKFTFQIYYISWIKSTYLFTEIKENSKCLDEC